LAYGNGREIVQLGCSRKQPRHPTRMEKIEKTGVVKREICQRGGTRLNLVCWGGGKRGEG